MKSVFSLSPLGCKKCNVNVVWEHWHSEVRALCVPLTALHIPSLHSTYHAIEAWYVQYNWPCKIQAKHILLRHIYTDTHAHEHTHTAESADTSGWRESVEAAETFKACLLSAGPGPHPSLVPHSTSAIYIGVSNFFSVTLCVWLWARLDDIQWAKMSQYSGKVSRMVVGCGMLVSTSGF